MNISDGIAQGSIFIQTVHSFLYQLLHGLGILPDECPDFLEQYERYKNDAVDMLDAIQKADIEKLILSYPKSFDWDFILIDESQDWPRNERDILFSVYDYHNFILADGIDQLVRNNKVVDWRENIDKKNVQVVSLTRSLRLKAGLSIFVQEFAHAIGLTNWDIEYNPDIYGGTVLIIEGSYTDNLSIHDELLQKNETDGNAPIDMLFCVPPTLVGRNEAGGAYSFIGKRFTEWGFKIWDGTSGNVRDNYPTNIEQLRIVQYESCRGLEGWTVVNLGFDQFYDHKLRTYKPTEEESTEELFDEKKTASMEAARWLMIPLTRAIDTLVIQISSADNPLGRILSQVAEKCRDTVEWRKV